MFWDSIFLYLVFSNLLLFCVIIVNVSNLYVYSDSYFKKNWNRKMEYGGWWVGELG